MAAVFELVFELFGPLIQGRIKVYSIGFQKGELKPLLCEYGETKCKCMPLSPPGLDIAGFIIEPDRYFSSVALQAEKDFCRVKTSENRGLFEKT